MFNRCTQLRFAGADSPAPVAAAFAELRTAVAAVAGTRQVDTLTEVMWAALHGLATLGRNQRLSSGHDTDRLELLVAQFRLDRS